MGDFRTENAYLTVADHTSFDVGINDFTAEAWVKPVDVNQVTTVTGTNTLDDGHTAHYSFKESMVSDHDTGVSGTNTTGGAYTTNHPSGTGNSLTFTEQPNITIPDPGIVPAGGSVSFWMKVDGDYTPVSQNYAYVMGMRNNFPAWAIQIGGDNPENKITHWMRNDSNSYPNNHYVNSGNTTDVYMFDNTWIHLVLTWATGAGVKWYFDNVLVDHNTDGPTDFSGFNASSGVIYLGNLPNQNTGQWAANTEITELSFWNREITAAEVTELYNDGDSLPYSEYGDWSVSTTTVAPGGGGVFQIGSDSLKMDVHGSILRVSNNTTALVTGTTNLTSDAWNHIAAVSYTHLTLPTTREV